MKEFFEKYGKWLSLGGLGLALISVFLPFVSISIFGYSVSANLLDVGFWGWLCLILFVLGLAVVVIETFAKQVFEKVNNDIITYVVNYLPIGAACIGFLITLIEGLRAGFSYLSVGFYFIILGTAAAAFAGIYNRFVLKNLFTLKKGPAPVAPAPEQNNNNQ